MIHVFCFVEMTDISSTKKTYCNKCIDSSSLQGNKLIISFKFD